MKFSNVFAHAARGLSLLAVVVASACDSQAAPGSLAAMLVSPNGPEGAAYVTLFGPGITVSPLGARTFSHAVGDTVHVVLVRDQPGDLSFLINVPDTTQHPAVVIREVAGGDNRLRADASAYRLDIQYVGLVANPGLSSP
jgi:hypothetical protein